jgi:hypothetical protein
MRIADLPERSAHLLPLLVAHEQPAPRKNPPRILPLQKLINSQLNPGKTGKNPIPDGAISVQIEKYSTSGAVNSEGVVSHPAIDQRLGIKM